LLLLWFLCGLMIVSLLHPARAVLPVHPAGAIHVGAIGQSSIGQSSIGQSSNLRQLLQQGISLYEGEQYAAAIAIWEQSVSMAVVQADQLAQALALSNLSLAYQQLGQWAEAEQSIASSLSLLQTLASATDTPAYAEVLAKALNTQGHLYWSQGKLEQSLHTWQAAAQSYLSAGDERGIILANINQAQALQSLGFGTQTVEILQEVYQRLQQQPDASLQTTGLRSLGQALRRIGKLDRSLSVLQESIERAEHPNAKAAALLELGNTEQAFSDRAVAIGKLEVAEPHAEAALQAYQTAAQLSDTPALRLQSQLNQLSFLVQLGKRAEASLLWPSLQSSLAELPLNRTAVYARLNFAWSLTCLKQNADRKAAFCVNPARLDSQPESGSSTRVPTAVPSWETIAQLLATAVDQARQLNDLLAESYALGQLGGVYEQLGQWSEAQTLTQQALLLTEVTQIPDSAYRWQWQLGRLLNQQGQPQAAIEAYGNAVRSLQSIRRDLLLISPEIQFSLRDNVEPVYREFVDLLLRPEQAAQPSQFNQPSQSNLKQAIQTIDALQLTELENFLGCALFQLARIDEEVIDPAAAKLYPILLQNRLAMIFELPGQPLEYREINLSQSEIAATVRKLRDNLTEPGRTPEVLAEAKQLYQWLIRPLEPVLTQHPEIETLVFVLDGTLRNIPMGVLYDGEQYLIEKGYAIAVSPRLELFRPGVSPKPLNVFRGGVEMPQVINGKSFPAIEQLREELEQIPSPLTRLPPLLNQAFTKVNIQQQLQTSRFSAIHWKTHGVFSSDPAETYLVAYQETITMNDWVELVQSARQSRNEPLELLVLSACETARGDNRAVLGLAGIAVRTGARSTISTLWRADDDANTKLTAQFYQQLTQPGTTKAEALRQAQLGLLKESGYPAPYFWATYVLVGNWL
jgi:CHAT domain-containing protein